jgi:hypothetical protein
VHGQLRSSKCLRYDLGTLKIASISLDNSCRHPKYHFLPQQELGYRLASQKCRRYPLHLHRDGARQLLPHYHWARHLVHLLPQATDHQQILKWPNSQRKRSNGYGRRGTDLERKGRVDLWKLKRRICHRNIYERS